MTVRPTSMPLRAFVTTPFSTRSTITSEMTPLWTPRSRCSERAANGDGQTADTHLDRRAVRNEGRDWRRDASVDLVGLGIGQQDLVARRIR